MASLEKKGEKKGKKGRSNFGGNSDVASAIYDIMRKDATQGDSSSSSFLHKRYGTPIKDHSCVFDRLLIPPASWAATFRLRESNLVNAIFGV